MNSARFDQISNLFAERRVSRRRAMKQGGTAIAAGAIAVAGLSNDAFAQDATPEVDGKKVEFLFA